MGKEGHLVQSSQFFCKSKKKKYSCPCLSSLKFSFYSLNYVNHVSIPGPRFLLSYGFPYGLRALSWDISFLLRCRERVEEDRVGGFYG